MRKDQWIKIAALNLGIAIVDVILFSEAFLHIDITGGNAFQAALGVTAILMSITVFAYGNYRLLFGKQPLLPASEIKTVEDCEKALELNYGKKVFDDDITTILEQIKRLQKKKETIDDILLQKFSSSEMSYSKFRGTILDVEKVFFLNTRSIINKLNAFDDEDYNHVKNNSMRTKYSEEILQMKMSIFNEYISFVREAKEDNEEVLLKLDKVLLEISRFNSLEAGELENMSAMKEIDELIQNAKWFK